ncbi:MAG TPA: MBOAT family protein [Clostridiales bacterium]|nr:MBOAT family protein [Clostridiales bacterium]
MVFSSPVFLFIFLPFVFGIYFLVPSKQLPLRNLVLLCFSLFFYFYGEQRATVVILMSIAGNYFFALAISEQKQECSRKRQVVLWSSVLFNLGILFYYKYANFFFENLNLFLSEPVEAAHIALPIGVSFFTFQGMSYVFDVYRGLPPQRNILNVALYISLFPQLVAGPIVRYETIQSELTSRQESSELVFAGLSRFVVGLGKKMLLANTMGEIADSIFQLDFAVLSPCLSWLGAAAYAFQILFDFSGYSDMAIGLGLVFGFHFLDNFNYPYISTSITEFWRRWHISLSTWFRDYVYIPLGGNRKGSGRQIVNIAFVWALTGLWHGAAWNFVVWGLYFAFLLIVEKLVLGRVLEKAWRPLAHLYSLTMILIGWVIFNSPNLEYIGHYLSTMFSLNIYNPIAPGYGWFYIQQYKIEWILCFVFSTPLIKIAVQRYQKNPTFEVLHSLSVIAVLLVSILYMVNTSFNPFIYFRF